MIDTLVTLLGGEAKTVAFAIFAGVFGFLAKSAYDLWLARRKDRLDRVNQQLKLLYGPLYALNLASHRAWSAFRKNARPGRAYFGTEPPPSPAELEAWRLWMTTVFKPIHDEMVSIISKNADLLLEDDLPDSLQDFLAHVAAYAVVFQRWGMNDFSVHTSVKNYPTEALREYLESSYRKLKNQQRKLIAGRV